MSYFENRSLRKKFTLELICSKMGSFRKLLTSEITRSKMSHFENGSFRKKVTWELTSSKIGHFENGSLQSVRNAFCELVFFRSDSFSSWSIPKWPFFRSDPFWRTHFGTGRSKSKSLPKVTSFRSGSASKWLILLVDLLEYSNFFKMILIGWRELT